MVELFLAFLGRYARIFIDWYVRNTLVLSSLVVIYGLLVVIAKNNLTKVEEKLLNILNTVNPAEISEKLGQTPLNSNDIQELKKGLCLPLITSPGRLFFSRITNRSLVRVFSSRAG